MCPTRTPDLGTNAVFSPSPLRMAASSLSQEGRGIQELGQVAWQPSPAQPPLLLTADPVPPTVGDSRPQQKGNGPGQVSGHTCPGSTCPTLTTPNPPRPVDLQEKIKHAHR